MPDDAIPPSKVGKFFGSDLKSGDGIGIANITQTAKIHGIALSAPDPASFPAHARAALPSSRRSHLENNRRPFTSPSFVLVLEFTPHHLLITTNSGVNHVDQMSCYPFVFNQSKPSARHPFTKLETSHYSTISEPCSTDFSFTKPFYIRHVSSNARRAAGRSAITLRIKERFASNTGTCQIASPCADSHAFMIHSKAVS